MKTLAERFWAKVDTSAGPSACWPWTAATNERGYGVLHPAGRRNGPTVKAHRVSAELAGIDIADRFVLHACDNPACVNPAHLRVGDHDENMRDMSGRDRSNHGSRNPNARLTEEKVGYIKALLAAGYQHKEIAQAFGVSRPTISYIAEGKTWRRVDAVTPPAARDLMAAVVEVLAAA